MKVEPQKEHQWLRQLVGEWTYEGEALPGADEPGEQPTGTETMRALGDVWIIGESEGTMPGGGPATSLITVGYDAQKGQFVGTWIGSMMTNLWVYESGWLDESGKVLTLEAEGPSMAGDGKTAKYRDIIEIKSADHHIMTGHTLGDDVAWQQFMTMHYRRKK